MANLGAHFITDADVYQLDLGKLEVVPLKPFAEKRFD
jgi:hypothetical protein